MQAAQSTVERKPTQTLPAAQLSVGGKGHACVALCRVYARCNLCTLTTYCVAQGCLGAVLQLADDHLKELLAWTRELLRQNDGKRLSFQRAEVRLHAVPVARAVVQFLYLLSHG